MEMVNYSVKISQETKDALLTKITESNLTAGEFVTALLTTYEASQNKESLFDVQELRQLENHLIRVKEIYIGLAKRLKDEQTDRQLTQEKLIRELEAAQADTITAKELAEKELEAAKNRIAELEKEVQEIQEKEQHARDLAATSTAILKTQQEQTDYLQNEVARLRSELANTNVQPEQPATERTMSDETISGDISDDQAGAVPPPAAPKAKAKSSRNKKGTVAADVADAPPRADE